MIPTNEDLHNIFTPDLVKPLPVKKKKAVNSKAKGKGFEGEIAKTLSTTFAPYEFKRVLHSGAILGGKNAINMGKYSEALANLFIGDVVCINDADQVSNFKFSIECKFYKNPESLDNFLGVTNSNLPMWYNECVVDAKKVNKTPLLIVKYNRSSIYCIISSSDDLPMLAQNRTVNYVEIQKDNLIVFLFKDALLDQQWWFKPRNSNTINVAPYQKPEMFGTLTGERP